MLTMGGHIYSPDGELLFRTTQSLAENRTLTIEPLMGFGTMKGEGNAQYAQYGIGLPLAGIPFYLAGKIASQFTSGDFFIPLFAETVQYHTGSGTEYLLRFAVSFANLFITALSVVVLILFAWWLTADKKSAIVTGALYGAATLALPHSRTFFTEPLAALMVFLSLFFLFKGTNLRNRRWILLAGITFGYALLTRLDSLVFFPGLVLFLALENTRFFGTRKKVLFFFLLQFRARALLRWVYFLAPIACAVALLAALNLVRFGEVFATGYEDQPEGVQFSTPVLAGLYGYLFSVGKGIFFFSPPLVLFFFSIKRLWKEWANLGAALCVMIAAFILVQSTWQNWAGGWCWGARHIFQVHILLALPIVMLIQPPRSSVVRISVIVLLVAGIAVQVYGASQSFIDFYIEFYRTPTEQPNAYALYSPQEIGVLQRYYRLYAIPAPGEETVPTDFRYMIAPINDSIYVMQNSQWYGYATMWKYGYTDFFWLRVLRK